MRHFLKKPRNMLVQDYIAHMTEINSPNSPQLPKAGMPPSYWTTNY